jgi:hypothetical protein
MSIDVANTLNQLNRRLTILSNLLGYQIAQGKTLSEGAPILRRLGLTSSEIAIIFDSTPGAVSVRLAEAKRGGRGGKRKAQIASEPQAETK